MRLKNKIKVAIDSPAGAGAGTQAKLISKHYNLFYLDTGKIYRILAFFKFHSDEWLISLIIFKKDGKEVFIESLS